MLGQHMAHGSLTIRFPDGTARHIVRHPASPILSVAITSWAWARRLVANPGLAFGEAFVDGGFVMLEGTVFEFMDCLFAVDRRHRGPVLTFHDTLARLGRRIQQYNPVHIARRNVARHYDLSAEFYRLLLDEDRQYSCAYFVRGDETIDEAQRAKKRHIAAKLLLDRPGLRVLDIGSGWGGMALTLARDYGADVTGITLSREQLAVSQQRAAEAGLSDRVRFELIDYRTLDRSFDRHKVCQDLGQTLMDQQQPRRQRQQFRRLDGAATDMAQPVAVAFDHAPAGAAEAGIDAQNANRSVHRTMLLQSHNSVPRRNSTATLK